MMAGMKFTETMQRFQMFGHQRSELIHNAEDALRFEQLKLKQQQMINQGMQQYREGRKMASELANPLAGLGVGEVIDRYEITDHTPEPVEVKIIEKPIPSVLTEIKTDLKEYAEYAAIVGVSPAELIIETFKAFLYENDIPVFNLKEVIAYMDDKAKKESKDQAGWDWIPLREKDHRQVSFGRRAEWVVRGAINPASDHYALPSPGAYRRIYDKLVPLHALKKVALIDKHFGDKVGVFVCDYAPIPAIPYPDPFLMAVIANPKVREGEGRFVIDFWNEPGFGLNSQLK